MGSIKNNKEIRPLPIIPQNNEINLPVTVTVTGDHFSGFSEYRQALLSLQGSKKNPDNPVNPVQLNEVSYERFRGSRYGFASTLNR